MYRHPLLITLLVILAASVTLIAYDVWLYSKGGSPATISWQTYMAARSEPIIPFLLGVVIGVLGGHLFWRIYGQ